MEKMQQRLDAPSITRTERSQNDSIADKQSIHRPIPRQEPTTPWFGDEKLGSLRGAAWPTYGAQPDDLVSPALSQSVIERSKYPRISVVIPTRNEAANLPYVLPHIPAIVDEVILVDGHSTDGTIGAAQQLLPGIRVIEQQGKGKGDAVRAGFAACTGDIIVMLDADGSANPQEIPAFVEALLAGNDFAKGSRFAKGGRSHDITRLRHMGNSGLSWLVNTLFGTRFSDLCYGYNAFWKHCLNYMAIDSDGFEVETLINIRMHRAGLRIAEVPSIEYRRIHGVSNLNAFSDGWRVLATILKERSRKTPNQVQLPGSLLPFDADEPQQAIEEIFL